MHPLFFDLKFKHVNDDIIMKLTCSKNASQPLPPLQKNGSFKIGHDSLQFQRTIPEPSLLEGKCFLSN